MAEANNKRRIDRVRLYAPISANVESQRITVIDVSQIGARIEHAFPLSTGSITRIVFDYDDDSVGIDCVVVRCKLDRSLIGGTPSYTSGLRYVNADDPAIDILLRMLHNVVTEDLDARKYLATKKKLEGRSVAARRKPSAKKKAPAKKKPATKKPAAKKKAPAKRTRARKK